MKQHQIPLTLVGQQKEELAQHRREVAELRTKQEMQDEKSATVWLLKPTIQKLGAHNDIEHFLATFERITDQQGWPPEVWPT